MIDGVGEIRLVLTRAAAAARRVGSMEIEPSHLMGGIVDLPGSRGAALLEQLGLDIDQLRRALDLSMQVQPHGAQPPTLSASSIETLVVADAEAARACLAETGSDDLILAIVEVGGSLVGGILESLGVTLSAVRSAMARLRGFGPEEERLTERHSTASTPIEPAAPEFMSPEWVEALRGRSENMHYFQGAGALIRVIAIGQVVTVGDLTVELSALEVREGLMYLHWRAHSASPRWLGQPDVAISDPLGTPYGVMPGSGSGGEAEWSGEMWIGPTVPTSVRQLTIEIRRFGEPSPMFHMREEIPHGPLVGPWRFEVDLAIE